MAAGIWAASSTVHLSAQDTRRNPPPGASVPLATNNIITKQTPQPVVEAPHDENSPVFKGIVIMGSTNGFVRLGVEGVTNVVVNGPDFLKQHSREVKMLMEPYLGKPLTDSALKRLQADLIFLSRRLDRPVVDVFFPQQDIPNGTPQIVVYEGKLNKLSVVFQGKKWFNGKWFSDSFITKRIHLHRGDSISLKQLNKDIDRLNHNPTFREVGASFKQGDFQSEKSNNAGITDIDITVKDRFPLRVFGGYDDYGLKVLGENQVFGGFNYGNLFGVDQQINYQYLTDISFDHLQSHSGSYVVPLPWGGNTLTLFGNYNKLKADLSQIGFPINNNGDTYQLSLRYDIPLPRLGKLDHTFAFGFDYKSADTAVEFGKTNLPNFSADIDQAVVEYRAFLRDGWGLSQLILDGYYSPGGLLGKNANTNFDSFHSGLKADYYYGRASAQRDFDHLPGGFVLVGKGSYQYASTGLLPSEELYLGGYSSIRGYPENIVSGDEGWIGTAEIHRPFKPISNWTRQQNIPGINGDNFDVFGFYDYGSVKAKSPNVPSDVHLSSVGAGLIYNLSHYLSVNAAYGYQLQNLPAGTPEALTKDKWRVHVAATVSF